MATQTQTLFQKINRLPSRQLAEVEKFVDSLEARNEREFLQFRENLPNDESALVEIIKRKSRIPKHKRVNDLRQKLREETLIPEEHAELLELNAVIENNNAERVAALGKLAELRQISLPELMRQLGIKKPKYD